MATSIGERLLERGRVQGMQKAVLAVLEKRFSAVSPSLVEQLQLVEDPERLDALLDAALGANSLEEFTQALS